VTATAVRRRVDDKPLERRGMAHGLPSHDVFPALDGVRAIAVGAVVATHAAFWTGRYIRGPFSPVLARLDSGVALFFVLSGFLLARPWLVAARDGLPGPSTTVYLWRRALRILPLYWITMVAAWALIVQNNPRWQLADWWRHGFLLQIYHAGWWPRGGLSQTWSLCAEVSFYLLLPFLGAAALAWTRWRGWHPGHLLTGTVALAAVSVIWPYVTFQQTWAAAGTASLWLPAFLSWFAGGMALAVVHVHHTSGRTSPAWRAGMHLLAEVPGCWWAAGAALFAVALTPVAGPLGLSTVAERTPAVVRNLLYAGFATCFVFPMVFSTRSRPFAVLAHPVMRRLGEVSYGVFLLHLIVLQGVMNLLGYHTFSGSFLFVFTLTAAGSVILAMLSFRYVEAPAMRLRRLVRPRRRAISAPAAS
jgi:peptidoglycan/LPS O-acetylase OafA/YrhL